MVWHHPQNKCFRSCCVHLLSLDVGHASASLVVLMTLASTGGCAGVYGWAHTGCPEVRCQPAWWRT